MAETKRTETKAKWKYRKVGEKSKEFRNQKKSEEINLQKFMEMKMRNGKSILNMK